MLLPSYVVNFYVMVTSKCYDDSIHLFHDFKLLSQCMGRIPGKLLPEAERKWQVSKGFSHDTEGQLNDWLFHKKPWNKCYIT